MKLGDLEFKAIDFQGVYEAVGIPLGTDLTPLADHVNRLLKERLRKAPKFDFTVDEYGMREWTDSGLLGTLAPTHQGRLACMEECRTDKELHDADKCL